MNALEKYLQRRGLDNDQIRLCMRGFAGYNDSLRNPENRTSKKANMNAQQSIRKVLENALPFMRRRNA